MSSLQKQLASLRTAEGLVQGKFNAQERPSLLFSFREAANISPTKVTELGLEGFALMAQTVPELQRYRRMLFEEEWLKEADRTRLTPIQNQEVKQQIQEVLLLLSPHLTNINCMKVIEYLLRKFDVHLFETELLIVYFMPFHASPVYTKLLQNLQLKRPEKWYAMLESQSMAGQPIERAWLISTVIRNVPGILGEIAKNIINYAEISKLKLVTTTTEGGTASYFVSKETSPSDVEQESIHFRFYCAIVCDLASTGLLNDGIRMTLKNNFWKFTAELIDNKRKEFFKGVLFIMSLFAVHKVFDLKELKAAFLDLTANLSDLRQKDAIDLGKMLFLLCSIEEFKLTSTVIQSLKNGFENVFKELLKNHSAVHFSLKLLAHLNHKLTKGKQLKKQYLDTILKCFKLFLQHDTKFTESTALQKLVLSKLAEIVIKLMTITNLKEVDNHNDNFQLLTQLVESTGSHKSQLAKLVTDAKLHSPKQISEFKQNFKRLFGDCSQFGVLELSDALLRGTKDAYFGGDAFLNLNDCPTQQKLSFLENLNRQIQAKAELKLADKGRIAKLIQDLLDNETDITATLLECTISNQLSDNNLIKVKTRTKVIDLILSHKELSVTEDIRDKLIDFCEQSSNDCLDNLFCTIFTAVQTSNENDIQDNFNDPLSLRYLFALEYNKLLSVLQYFCRSKSHVSKVANIVLKSIGVALTTVYQTLNSDEKSLLYEHSIKLCKLFSIYHKDSIKKQIQTLIIQLNNYALQEITKETGHNPKFITSITEALNFFSNGHYKETVLKFIASVRHSWPLLKFLINNSYSASSESVFETISLISKHFPQGGLPKKFFELTVAVLVKLIAMSSKQNPGDSKKIKCLIETFCSLSKCYANFAFERLGKQNNKSVLLERIGHALKTNIEHLVSKDAHTFIKRKLILTDDSLDKRGKLADNNPENVNVLTIATEHLQNSNMSLKAKMEYSVGLLNLMKDTHQQPSAETVAQLRQFLDQGDCDTTLIALLISFYLKNSDYDNALIISQNYAKNCPDNINELFYQLRVDYSNSQDVMRLTAVLDAWYQTQSFVISTLKYSVIEHLCLSVLIFDFELTESSYRLEGFNDLIADFEIAISKSQKNAKTLSEIACLLSVCWSFLKVAPLESSLRDYALRLAGVCLKAINDNNHLIKLKRYEFDQEMENEEGDQKMVIINFLRSKFNVQAFVETKFDFVRIIGQTLHLSIPSFLNHFTSTISGMLNTNFLHDSLSVSSQNVGEWFSLVLLKTATDQLLFLAEKDQKTAYNTLKALIDEFGNNIDSCQNDQLRLQLLTYFESIVCNLITRILSLNIQNRYFKACELLLLQLRFRERITRGNFGKTLSELSTKEKLFSQLLINSGSFASSAIGLAINMNSNVFSKDINFMFYMTLALQLLEDYPATLDSILARFIFKLLKRSMKAGEAPEVIFLEYLEELVSISKLCFGLLGNVSDLTKLMTNAEKQTLHFLREQAPKIRARLISVCCHLFQEVLNERLFLDSLNTYDFEAGQNDGVSEFILFIILTRKGQKLAKLTTDYHSQLEKMTEITETLFTKRINQKLLLRSFGWCQEQLSDSNLEIGVLDHLLTLILNKFEGVKIHENMRSELQLFFDSLFQDCVMRFKFEGESEAERQVRLLQKALVTVELFASTNPGVTLLALNHKSQLTLQIIDLCKSSNNIELTLTAYKIMGRLARSLRDEFVDILNDLCRSFLDYCQMSASELTHKTLKIERFSDVFVSFFGDVIESFGGLTEPFIRDILLVAAEVEKLNSSFLHKLLPLLELLASQTEFRVVFSHVREAIDYAIANADLTVLRMTSFLIMKTIHKIESDTFTEKNSAIFGLIQRAIDYAVTGGLTDEEFNNLKDVWIQIFLEFAVKCNQSQLEKFFQVFLRSIAKKQSAKELLCRKLLVAQTLQALVDKLGPFALGVTSESMQFCIDLLNDINSIGAVRKGKEKRTLGETSQELWIGAHKSILKTLEKLPKVDTTGFLDAYKFEILTKPIIAHYAELRFGMEKGELIEHFETFVSPSLAALVNFAQDELKTKSVISSLLNLANKGERVTKLLVADAIKQIIKLLGEMFLGILQEVVLRISDLASDPDEEVAVKMGQTVRVIEELAGESIKDILQQDDMNFD